MKRLYFIKYTLRYSFFLLAIIFQLLPFPSFPSIPDSVSFHFHSLVKNNKLDQILDLIYSEKINKLTNTKLFILLDEAQVMADSLEDYVKLAKTYHIKGLVHKRLGNYNEALNNFMVSLSYFENIQDFFGIAKSLNCIGFIHEAREEYDKAIDYYSEALKLAHDNQHLKLKALSLKNLGKCFEHKKDYPNALTYYLRAIQFYEDSGEKLGIAHVMNDIANVYKSRGFLNKALYYYNQSLETFIGLNDEEQIALTYYMMGEVFRDVQIFEKSLDYYSQSLEMALRINLKPVISDNYKSLYLLHSQSGDHDKALSFFENHILYKDSLFNEKSEKKIVELQARYDFESKDKEIALLNAKKELQEAEIKEKKLINASLATVLVLIIILLLLIYRQYHLKQKANEILALHNQSINKQNINLQSINSRLIDSEHELKQLIATKDKFFSIISHDLRSPLNSLSGLLQLIIKYSDNLSKEELIHITTKLDRSVKNLSDLLSNLLQWSMSQMGNMEFRPEPLDLADLIKGNIDLIKLQAEEKGLKIALNIAPIQVMCDKNMLNFILRNILSNAIKFTNKGGNIVIEGAPFQTCVCVNIMDSGVGIDGNNLKKLFKLDEHFSTEGTNQEGGTGLGLILCKEFIEKNNGLINVESKLGVGTKFTITLPLHLQDKDIAPEKQFISHL